MTLQFDPISTAQIVCSIVSVVVALSGLLGLMIVRKVCTQERSGVDGTTVICVYSLLYALVTIVCLFITSCQMPGCPEGGVYRLQYQNKCIDQLQSEKELLEAKLKVAISEKK